MKNCIVVNRLAIAMTSLYFLVMMIGLACNSRDVAIPDTAEFSIPVESVTGSDISSNVDDFASRLDMLRVADAHSVVDYNRYDYRHWIDADRDCQSTRQEVLIAQSDVDVQFISARQCIVLRGAVV